MEKIKKYLPIIVFIIFYFSFPVLILHDSAHFMGYVEILEGKIAFSNWDIIRGPVFPLIIFLSNFVFGKTVQGLLFLTGFFYLAMLFISKKILKSFFLRRNKIGNFLIISVFFVFVIINPIIFGYYHSLLTEFVAMSGALLSCYVAWKSTNFDFSKDRRKYFLVLLFYLLFVPFTWFLKQTYITIAIFPLFASFVIEIFSPNRKKLILNKLLIILACTISLLSSIFLWNQVLRVRDVVIDPSRRATSFLGEFLVLGINNSKFIEEPYDSNYLLAIGLLDTETINSLTEENKTTTYEHKIVELKDSNLNLIDQIVINVDSDGQVGLTTGLKFVFNSLLKYPGLIIKSYVSNYLGVINIFDTTTDNGVNYFVKDDFQLAGCNENCSIAISITKEKSNIYYLDDTMRLRVLDYEQYNNAPIIARKILNINSLPSIIIFNFLFFFLPFSLVFAIFYSIFHKGIPKKGRDILNFVIISFTTGLLHLLTCAVTNSVIDRYASIVYIPVLIGYLGIFRVLFLKEKISFK